MLNQWKQIGVFDYMLPFLLIFALIYGILTKIKLFTEKDNEPNKIINAIIALSVALMALQFDFVSIFFSEIFPRMGVGLSILLVFLILAGLFMDPGVKWVSISFFVVSVVIAGYAFFGSTKALGWDFSSGFSNILPELIPYIVIIGLIVAVVMGGKKTGPKYEPLGWFPAPKSKE